MPPQPIPPKIITDLDSVVLSETNQTVYDYWVNARGQDPIPPTAALDPVKLPKWVLPNFTVVEVINPGPKFRVRLTGSRARDVAGQDYTGQMVDQMPGAREVLERFTWCVLNLKPYCARSRLNWSSNDFLEYEALVLPFGDPDGGIEKLASVIHFPSQGSSQTRSSNHS